MNKETSAGKKLFASALIFLLITAAATVLGPIVSRNINSIRYANGFAGSDYCGKLTAAIADLPATGGTIDATGLEGAQSCASNPFSGVTKPVKLIVGWTTISTTVPWVIASNSITIKGSYWLGSKYVYTGGASAYAMKVGTATPATVFITDFVMEDMYISGNANTTDALFMTGTHRGALSRLEIANATSCGLHTQFDVVTTYKDIHVSSLSSGAFTTQPACGIDFGQIDANHQTTASVVLDPVVEGVTGSGIKLSGANGITIMGGTSEDNNRGTEVTSGSFNNQFIGLDQEANTVEDTLENSGYNTYIGGVSAKLMHLSSTAFRTVVRGGQYNGMQMDAGEKQGTFVVAWNASGTATWADSGTENYVIRAYNVATGTNSGVPYMMRDTTSLVGLSGMGTPDRSDMLSTVVKLTTTPTVLSNTAYSSTVPWRVLFIGLWSNNFEGAGLAQPAWIQEATTASPTITIGSVVVTISLNGSNQLQAATGANAVAFAGRIITLSNNTELAGTSSMALKGSVTATSLISSGTAFASLGTPANGQIVYCPDCTIANPCAGAGSGAFAKRLNGVWVCN